MKYLIFFCNDYSGGCHPHMNVIEVLGLIKEYGSLVAVKDALNTLQRLTTRWNNRRSRIESMKP